MPKPILSPDSTYLELNKPREFQRFFLGLMELLKKKLQRINVGGSDQYYYTCGEIHDRCNKNWDSFVNLWAYTDRKQLDFYMVKDLIVEHLGWELECECEILRDEKAIRRRELKNQFGVDFDQPGEQQVEIV